VTICLAGHPAPVLQRADGTVQVAGRGGTLLGFKGEPRLQEVGVTLAPGDRLVLFTDGLSEAMESLDPPRTVQDVLQDGRDRSLDTLADRLLDQAALGRRVDDVAICVVEVTGARSLRSV
jgi:serine/threonine protein phosphatase PrpC